jgi:hypothetical protein
MLKRSFMKYYRFAVILIVLFSFIGCTSRFVTIEKPNTPFERPGYTVHSPQGEGWKFFESDQIGQHVLFFGLPMNSRTHSLYANVTEIPSTAKFNTPREFQSFFDNMTKTGFDSRRYKMVDEKTEPYNKFGDFSFIYYSLVEDHGAKNSDDVPYLLLESVCYYFIHPYNKDQLINVIYSERAKPGELDKNFREKAKAFVEGLQLKK